MFYLNYSYLSYNHIISQVGGVGFERAAHIKTWFAASQMKRSVNCEFVRISVRYEHMIGYRSSKHDRLRGARVCEKGTQNNTATHELSQKIVYTTTHMVPKVTYVKRLDKTGTWNLLFLILFIFINSTSEIDFAKLCSKLNLTSVEAMKCAKPSVTRKLFFFQSKPM